MTDLQSGTYAPRTNIRVTTWRAPDSKGDGDEVWRNKQDPTGQNIGRERVRDQEGTPVRNYKVPEGFQNFPSFDHTPHYLRVNQETGEPYRTPDGNTVEIFPGTILLEYPDGTSKTLTDEYEIYLFGKAHERVGSADAPDTSDDQNNAEEENGDNGDKDPEE